MVKPWFALSKTTPIKNVAIIGGGIAGCACAWRFAQAGYAVTLFEKNADIAQAASGNPVGLVEPYLTANHNVVDQFYTAGFLLTRQVLTQPLNGIAHIAHTPERQQRFQNLLAKRQFPDTFAQWLSAQEVSAKLGIHSDHPALWLPTAGMIDPETFCRALLPTHPLFQLKTSTQINTLIQKNGEWQLLDQHQKIHTASHVIIANAYDALQLAQTQDYPLKASPGQLSIVAPTALSQSLRHPMCYEGYMTPAINGQHIIGASYRHSATDLVVKEKDHTDQLTYLHKAFPQLADSFSDTRKTARVAVRALTPDHLPLVGPITNRQWLNEAYAKLRTGTPQKRAGYQSAQYLNNLYLCAGFGSRGLSGALLAAEVLLSLTTEKMLPVFADVYQAIHPSRFWIREITRLGKKETV